MDTLHSFSKPLVVFSHLRWEFVTQRPQHVMQRIAKKRPVLYVEEPIAPSNPEDDRSANLIQPDKNILVIQPIVSWDEYAEKTGALVRSILREHRLSTPQLWFYSPMFINVIDEVPHSQVIYDCMDELSAFRGAPPSLLMNERALLAQADVVFTGGRSLYSSKQKRHDNVYCFPSSVDRGHFEKANDPKVELPADLQTIPGPRVGFYGVIDERMDLALLDGVAKKNPKVSFVMIGPVVKIPEADLPKRENIHYLGCKSYQELPAYLKGFDVAMMPFALNEATEFISPTKTLEFMAAKKPIVSTPIKDVAEVYPKEVKIAATVNEFSRAVRSYLRESSSAQRRRERLQREVIERTSWDNTVLEMTKLMGSIKVPQEIRTPAVVVLPAPALSYSI